MSFGLKIPIENVIRPGDLYPNGAEFKAGDGKKWKITGNNYNNLKDQEITVDPNQVEQFIDDHVDYDVENINNLDEKKRFTHETIKNHWHRLILPKALRFFGGKKSRKVKKSKRKHTRKSKKTNKKRRSTRRR